jgi:hypothetical protein
MTLIEALRKKHTCNVNLSNVILKVIRSKDFIRIVVVSKFVK